MRKGSAGSMLLGVSGAILNTADMTAREKETQRLEPAFDIITKDAWEDADTYVKSDHVRRSIFGVLQKNFDSCMQTDHVRNYIRKCLMTRLQSHIEELCEATIAESSNEIRAAIARDLDRTLPDIAKECVDLAIDKFRKGLGL